MELRRERLGSFFVFLFFCFIVFLFYCFFFFQNKEIQPRINKSNKRDELCEKKKLSGEVVGDSAKSMTALG